MDQLAKLELSWSIGYTGAPVYFATNETVCFLNSNCLKLIDLNEGKVDFIKSPGDGIQTLAVNTNYGALAFSEDGLNARIFVYEITNLSKPHSVLSGGDGLGYTSLAFANNSSIMASCSNIPQIQLRIWNWVDSTVLCSVNLDSPLSSLSFNPVNWRHVCGSNEEGVTLWSIAKVSEEYHLQTKTFTLPYADGSFGKEEDGITIGGGNPSSGHSELKLTMSSITGLVGTGKEGFDPTYEVEPFKPIAHCWGAESRIFCSSKNQLILIDTETSTVKSLYVHDDDDEEPFDFTCLQLHSEGLFTGGKDGILHCVQVLEDSIKLKFDVDINKPISFFNLSPDFRKIIVGSSWGSLHVYDVGDKPRELSNDFYGDIVGVESLGGDKYVVCRSSGLLQIGSVEEAKWTSALQIDREVKKTVHTLGIVAKLWLILLIDWLIATSSAI